MNLSIIKKEMFGQNEMSIFQNDKNEIFMTREQIGIALEYKNPRRAIADIHNRNKERLDKFSSVSNLRTEAGMRETVIYNEQGIYEIIRRSNQPKADEFYDWVYELLSKLRKQELQIVQKPKSNLELMQMAVEELTNHDKRISYLEENMRINSAQEQAIRKRANHVVVESLGGKNSPAYKEMAFKVFSAFWRDFKNHFEIPRYGDLPKKKFEEGLRFISMWQPSTSLKIEIDNMNRQQTIEEVI